MHKRIPIRFKTEEQMQFILGNEHLHIYKWREKSNEMTCDCGKPIPTERNRPYYGLG